MNQRFQTIARDREFTVNRSLRTTLRNTLTLLGATFGFASFMAYFAMAQNAVPVEWQVFALLYTGLTYLIHQYKDSPAGVGLVFALTGFLGYTVGPMLNFYIRYVDRGPQIITASFVGTTVIFAGLSLYAVISETDFSYLTGMLLVGSIVLPVLALANMFFLHLPILSLAISGCMMLFSSGAILLQLSYILQSGERNYLLATVAIFVQLYNIFLILLDVLRVFSSNRRNR